MSRFFITGVAGFIGFHLARRLLSDGHQVFGYDAVTPYYDVRLKHARLDILRAFDAFRFDEAMLEDSQALSAAFRTASPEIVVHLAAQAGVRYSLENPRAYVGPAHFLFASTSSVYGANTEMPFTERQRTDHPLTLYAATKKANEDMAHAYSHLWKIPTTGLRFFTVYGPWGRPDMALFKFVSAMLNGQPIDVYNRGDMWRDFTYIDDLVEAIARLVATPPSTQQTGVEAESLSPAAPFRIVNIGGGAPVRLGDFISAIEQRLGIVAQRNLLPMQPGDVPATFAGADLLEHLTGYRPNTTVGDGVDAFVDWYLGDYQRLVDVRD
jgi:UDP-glucuronate 4-epimerase